MSEHPPELVEKVARAIKAEVYVEHQARAAIRAVHEAMREADEKMISASYRTDGHSRAAAAIWRAMLAAHPIAEAARDE